MMCAATEKARLPRFSLVMGIESCCEVDDLSCLGMLEKCRRLDFQPIFNNNALPGGSALDPAGGLHIHTQCGSWGLGAPGPAIVWGPLQGCDPMFPSWGGCKPPAGSRAEPPGQSIIIENWLKI